MEVNKTLRWLELCGSQELAQEEFISDDNQLAEDESATLLQALEKNTTIRQILWNGLGVSGKVNHILKRNREIECAREVLKNVLGLPDFVGGLVSSYLSKASLVDGKPSFELTSDLDSAAVIRKSAQPSVLSAKKSDMGLGVGKKPLGQLEGIDELVEIGIPQMRPRRGSLFYAIKSAPSHALDTTQSNSKFPVDNPCQSAAGSSSAGLVSLEEATKWQCRSAPR